MVNKKNIILILITLIGIISVQKVLINKLESTIILEENEIAVYVDGEKTDTFPTSSSGKAFGKIECTNSGVAEWDETNWKLTVKEINNLTVCNVYFVSISHLTTNFYGTLAKNDIESITFEDHINVPNGVLGSWDASDVQNNTIKAWYTDTNSNSKYELVIGQVGGVLAPENSANLFHNFQNLNLLDLTNFVTTDVTNMARMFRYTGYSSTTFTLNLGDRFNTGKVTDMSEMFDSVGYNDTQFVMNLGSNFDTSNVINMYGMFFMAASNSTKFKLDLGTKFNTGKVTNMGGMFQLMGMLSTVFTLNLGNYFDTSNVTDMSGMFSSVGMSSPVFTLNLGSKFYTNNVTSMAAMFVNTGYGNTSFTLNLGNNFDTSNVTNMDIMFGGTGWNSTVFTLNLGSKFNMSKVTNASSMFHGIGLQNPNFYINARYVTWNTSMVDFSYGSSLSSHKFYVKDATAVSFIQSKGGFLGTIVNCSTASCPQL